MFRLDGKTALVTGASQGIGRAIALRMATNGARVLIAARGLDKLERLAEEIGESGGEAHPVSLDISQPAEAQARVEALAEEHGDIDIVVNNAGITRDGLFARMSIEQWQTVINTNLTGAFAVTRAVVRGMMRQRWGRILFISSVVGLMGNPGQANYAASKAGMIGMAKSLARELGSRGITANVVAPGFIETAMTDQLGERVRKQMAEVIVSRRFGTPDEVAAATLFLASEEAGYITGEVINVSGGLYI